MKKASALTVLSLLALSLPLSTYADKASGPKAQLMSKYDLNHNGVIDGDEIAAVRKDFAAEPKGALKRFDTNSDGTLDDAEIAAMKPPGAKGKDGEKPKGKKKDSSVTPAPSPSSEAKPASEPKP
jgi:hypothetical protein